MLALINTKITKQPADPYLFTMSNGMKIPSYSQMVSYLHRVEIFKPIFSHKLPVCNKVVDGFVTKQANETVDYWYPFCCIGVTSFWHHFYPNFQLVLSMESV